MQAAVPDLCDLSDETEQTKRAYGLDAEDKEKAAYARQCLLARRLVERGVRFIELSCLTKGIGAGGAANPWDQHGDLHKGHAAMGFQVDQPIAALIRDLRQRGLLDETLIVWAGEFGRTPFSRVEMAETTIPSDSPSGWPVVVSAAARSTAPPTNSDTTPSRTSAPYSTCGQPSCIN